MQVGLASVSNYQCWILSTSIKFFGALKFTKATFEILTKSARRQSLNVNCPASHFMFSKCGYLPTWEMKFSSKSKTSYTFINLTTIMPSFRSSWKCLSMAILCRDWQSLVFKSVQSIRETCNVIVCGRKCLLVFFSWHVKPELSDFVTTDYKTSLE